MSFDLGHLERCIELAKRYGISHFKKDGLEFRFAESNQIPPDEDAIQETIKALEKEHMPPDDQMLFAASDTFEGDLEGEAKEAVDKLQEPGFSGT
jgi:hypothetical protein